MISGDGKLIQGVTLIPEDILLTIMWKVQFQNLPDRFAMLFVEVVPEEDPYFPLIILFCSIRAREVLLEAAILK